MVVLYLISELVTWFVTFLLISFSFCGSERANCRGGEVTCDMSAVLAASWGAGGGATAVSSILFLLSRNLALGRSGEIREW